MNQRTSGAQTSTGRWGNELLSHNLRAQPAFLPTLIRTFPLKISPLKIALSPLVEHYFYPVSTAPTITNTK
jgi:hypothetical protein